MATTVFQSGEKYISKYKDGEEVSIGKRYAPDGKLLVEKSINAEVSDANKNSNSTFLTILKSLAAFGEGYGNGVRNFNNTVNSIDPKPTICTLKKTTFGDLQMICP